MDDALGTALSFKRKKRDLCFIKCMAFTFLDTALYGYLHSSNVLRHSELFIDFQGLTSTVIQLFATPLFVCLNSCCNCHLPNTVTAPRSYVAAELD